MTSSDIPPSKLLRVAEGLTILAKYSGEYDIAAEHDEIFAGPDAGEKLTVEDRERLARLGWRENGKAGGFAIFV